jgi:hypothetical protein
MKKIMLSIVVMFMLIDVSYGQNIISSSIDFDKAEPLFLSKLKSEFPTKLKKAPNDYEFSLDKKEGYGETYLLSLNSKKYEVYVFKDKKSLIVFIQRLIGGGVIPGSWDSHSVCDCNGGIQCTCPAKVSSPGLLFAIP